MSNKFATQALNLLCLGFLGSVLALSIKADANQWPGDLDKTRIEFVKEIKSPLNPKQNLGFLQKIKNWWNSDKTPALTLPMGLDVQNGLVVVADRGSNGLHFLNTEQNFYRFVKSEYLKEDQLPLDVAISPTKIFVTFSGYHYIYAYDHKGNFLEVIQPNLFNGRLTGISYMGPNLFVVDTDKHRVYELTDKGILVDIIGKRGHQAGFFNYPAFVTTAKTGEKYITDTMNFRIQKFNRKNQVDTIIGSQGVMSGQLNRPKGVALDNHGNVYIVDNSFDNIQIFSSTGKFLLHFGSHGTKPGEFRMPTGIAIDNNLIYVTDTQNNRIQVFRILNG